MTSISAAQRTHSPTEGKCLSKILPNPSAHHTPHPNTMPLTLIKWDLTVLNRVLAKGRKAIDGGVVVIHLKSASALSFVQFKFIFFLFFFIFLFSSSLISLPALWIQQTFLPRRRAQQLLFSFLASTSPSLLTFPPERKIMLGSQIIDLPRSCVTPSLMLLSSNKLLERAASLTGSALAPSCQLQRYYLIKESGLLLFTKDLFFGKLF